MPNTETEYIVTGENVDLTNCDRELFQFSGAVQPHCALLVLTEPDLRIVQYFQSSGLASDGLS